MQFKKMMIGASLALSIGLFAACGSNNATKDTKESTAKTTESSVDLNKLDLPQLSDKVADDEYLVELVTTEGSVKIKLFPEQAPKAVENFVTHAKEGYYKDTPFHRVMKDFMIQGGDPKGDGTGGESIWKKGFKTEISNQLYNIRGALSMARSESRSSNGSQFFIVTNSEDVSDGLAIQYYPEKIIEQYKKGGTPQLDGEYTVFGQVTEGMDVVDKIAGAEVKDNSSGTEKSTPVDPVKVTEVKVLQEPKK
ncbi:peptidylprolyl isomerase [Enterococcus hulanensis]|uniref:peptidylprolyl isomerase n=1 Tax=Enterococcus hulanensis TaxID=2559929 RepID=UPI001A8F94C8|nr:peptidylprolyl isomerase [Enterococcus hulanensis]MBO0459626.1 peptidylprolyl isomerase [Enterococcus hulanensis]